MLPPRECARVYARGLAEWGQQLFADLPGIDRLAELGRRVADSVHQPMGLSLFAGWRAEPVPSNPAAAAALAVHVLREMRGDLHIQACAAYQLTALEAILGKDDPEPFPPPHAFADRRRAAEDLTDQLVAPAYSVLDPTERRDMLELLLAARNAL